MCLWMAACPTTFARHSTVPTTPRVWRIAPVPTETDAVPRVCGMHCESGDIVVHEVQLPADLKRGDILAVPVTGAYGRTMASNYNQALIPAVVGCQRVRRARHAPPARPIDDLLNLGRQRVIHDCSLTA